MKTNLNYNGPVNEKSVENFMSEQSKGCYVFFRVFFGSVLAIKSDRLLTNPQAPSDYPYGYYKNGKKCQWSDSRKITDQNTGVTR